MTFEDLIFASLCAFAGGVAVGALATIADTKRILTKLLVDLRELRS